MEIFSGYLEVLLPGESPWKTSQGGEEFRVAGNATFKLRVSAVTDYDCSFLG